MPRGDKSGPEGRGPMTGRGLGHCAGNDRPGCQVDAVPAESGFGRGFGRGIGRARGFGRGWGRGYGHGFGRGFGGQGRGSEFPAEPETTTALAAEVARLKDQLRALEERMADSKNGG